MTDQPPSTLRGLAAIPFLLGALPACGRAPASPAPTMAVATTDAAAAAAARNDYSKPETWLCRPGHDSLCTSDQSATAVLADGTVATEAWTAAANPAIDCFYVYPTVSRDPTPNSDMVAGDEERNVVHSQLGRFASQCRVFAPLYRQITLATLRAASAGDATKIDFDLPYNDVLDAWNHYLAHDNAGRGVVLIGHSQGSRILAALIAREIESKPVEGKIVSALLLGTNIMVPRGKDVGGTFKHMPLCRAATQTGCVISYVSFRKSAPPPWNTRFGRPKGGDVVGCTNPAALGGGAGELRPVLATKRTLLGPSEPFAWTQPPRPIDTPFVRLPGLLTAECVTSESASYLAITVNGNPSDPRTDDIPGDLVIGGTILGDWGLHLIDVNVALGNLIDVVAEQSRAYRPHR